MVLEFIAFVGSAAATAIGYVQARAFTANKLRYVDAVHRASTPIIAGIGAAVVAAPIVAILPIVGAGTAILFGAGVAAGVASGARGIRKQIGAG